MKRNHNQSWPKGMTFSAGLLHLGCCKDWKKKINFPEDWEYNPLKMQWRAKEGTKYFITTTDMKTKEVTKVLMIINDKDLLLAKE